MTVRGSEEWNRRYAEPGRAFGEEPNEFLLSQAELFPPGAAVLSLGEGEGRNAIYLAQRGVAVTAVDLSDLALQRLSERASELNLPITTEQADLTSWPLGESRWDAILSIWCHIPSELRRNVHGQVAAALKPGGVYVLEAYTPAQIARGTGGPSSPDLLPTAAGLRSELPGLAIELLEEKTRLVQEGALHQGWSDVVQLVARKI